MAFSLNRRYRYFRRYRRIVEVLITHGFGYFVELMDLQHLVPFRHRVLSHIPAARTRGARMRAAMEELGPTFIKLGQLLSARPHLVPADIVTELARLQDRVPPVPVEQITAEIEREMQRPLTQVFAKFEPEPLAAASIGQVHRAMLDDGTDVVVKVRRPGIDETVETDLGILAGLAELFDERWPSARVSLTDVVYEFSRVLRREMDFRLEAANIDRFRRLFQDDTRVYIPRVFSDLTTSRMLVLEFVDGVKINDLEGLRQVGIHPHVVAELGAEIFLKQVLIDGMFHGDPHPGNLFVLPDGRLAIIDFGVVGRLDERTIESIVQLFIGVIRRDADRMVNGLLRIGAVDDGADVWALQRDLADLIDRHHGKRLKDLALGAIVNEVLHLAHRHKLRLPTDLLLLGKALVTIEGLGQHLDPDFNALQVAEPFAKQLVERQLHPSALANRTVRDVTELLELLGGLPEKFERTLNRLNRGDVRVRVNIDGLERMVRRVERGQNRVAIALVFAALFVGSVLLLAHGTGPVLWGVPVLPAITLAGAAVAGMWLAVGIFRSGPM